MAVGGEEEGRLEPGRGQDGGSNISPLPMLDLPSQVYVICASNIVGSGLNRPTRLAGVYARAKEQMFICPEEAFRGRSSYVASYRELSF